MQRASPVDKMLVRIAPADIAMFRFLLESHENLAQFTVLERKTALLKVFFSPDQESEALRTLAEMAEVVEFELLPWPL